MDQKVERVTFIRGELNIIRSKISSTRKLLDLTKEAEFINYLRYRYDVYLKTERLLEEELNKLGKA